MSGANLPWPTKYRPQVFEDVIGNAITSEVLSKIALTGRIRNAYFFSGPKGTGKTTLARIFAKAITCLEKTPSGSPCNSCSNCIRANDQTLGGDVLEIDAASNNSVDSIRALNANIEALPLYGERRVIILDECHQLSSAAANALLKTLEEPPEHVVFILCTTDPSKVLETIKSRSVMFSIRVPSEEDLVGRLAKVCDIEGVQHETEALRIIAQKSDSVREALNKLDQVVTVFDKVLVSNTSELFVAMTSTEVLEVFTAATEGLEALEKVLEGKKFTSEDLFEGLTNVLRDLLEASIGVTKDINIKQLSQKVGTKDLWTLASIIGERQEQFSKSPTKIRDILLAEVLLTVVYRKESKVGVSMTVEAKQKQAQQVHNTVDNVAKWAFKYLGARQVG